MAIVGFGKLASTLRNLVSKGTRNKGPDEANTQVKNEYVKCCMKDTSAR